MRRLIILAAIVTVLALGVAVAVYAWPRTLGNRQDAGPQVPTKSEVVSLYDRGRYREAVPKLRRYLTTHKTDIEVWNMLAASQLLIGNREEALHAYEQILRVKPANQEALYRAGVLLRDQGRNDRAIAVLVRLTTLAPDKAQFHAELARAYVANKQYAEALSAWQQVIALTPPRDKYRATVYAEAASLYILQGQRALARRMLDNALAIDPANEYAKAELAQLQASESATATAGGP